MTRGRINGRDGMTIGNGDSHLELLLLILRGVPEQRREDWMRKWMPSTYSLLCASRLFSSEQGYQPSRTMREFTSGSMAHPIAPRFVQ